MRLARRLRQQSAGGLTPTQLSALATVERAGPVTLGDLALAERVQPPTITRVVAKLDEQGLVTRQTDPFDRRSALVATTAEGRRTLQQNRRRRDAYLARRLAVLTPDERARLERALPVIERLIGDEE